jgi:hypothetical protein
MAPSATFKWKMKPRAISWHNAWDTGDGRYKSDYVNPTRFRIALDARGSKSGANRITAYTWAVRGIDNPAFQPPAVVVKERKVPGRPKPRPRSIPSHKVEIDLDKILAGTFIPPSADAEFELPGRGRYRVTLNVTNEKRQSASATQDITLREQLVVSLGDSILGSAVRGDTSARK